MDPRARTQPGRALANTGASGLARLRFLHTLLSLFGFADIFGSQLLSSGNSTLSLRNAVWVPGSTGEGREEKRIPTSAGVSHSLGFSQPASNSQSQFHTELVWAPQLQQIMLP